MDELNKDIFRPEALAYHAKHASLPEGELLNLDRRWLGRAYWLLVMLVGVGVGFCILAPVREYTTGPAVIRKASDGHLAVVALLPAESRPRLEPGMQVRFGLSGQRFLFQTLKVRAVVDAVTGPSGARRYLGPALAEVLPVEKPVAILEADLPSSTFEDEGRVLQYHEGLLGRLEVPLSSEPLFFTLAPWAKRWVHHAKP